MKQRLVLLVVLIWFGFSGHSQKKDKKTVRTSESSCIRKSNIAFSKRAQYFPYNSYSQIKLISFKSEKALIVGPDLMKYLDSLVVNFGVFNEKEFFESTTLTSDQIEDLTDLVFNFGSNSRNVDISSCYSPRNAMIFLDEQNRVYAFIELCFECNKYRTSDSKITLGHFCTEKLKKNTIDFCRKWYRTWC